MRLAAALLGPILLLALGADDPKKDKDADKIQGTWEAVEMTIDGRPIPAEEVKEIQIVFTPDKMQLVGKAGIGKREYTYKIDPDTKPKSLDTTPLDGPFKGKTGPAIYELDGDNLKLCIPNKETKDRPADFKAEQGSNLGLFILKRAKS